MLMATPEFSGQVDWESVHIYFGDERPVPLNDPESNFYMVNKALLEHVPVPTKNIHAIHADPGTIRKDAERYENVLEKNLPFSKDGFPVFDLVLLGMGTDGHTASLFPDTDVLYCKNKSVAAVYVSKMQTWRISISFPVINNARHILILVTGKAKAYTVGRILSEASTEPHFPIQMIRAQGELEWYLDDAAALHIPNG